MKLKIGKFYENKAGEKFRFEGHKEGRLLLQKFIKGFEKGPGSGWQPAQGLVHIEPSDFAKLISINYFKPIPPPA